MTKAVIAGAGVAGPVTAMALRAAGIEAEVYEAYQAGSDGVGAYLSIAENGLAALGQLGLREQAQALGFATPGFEFHSGTGKRLGSVPTPTAMRTLRRSDLYAMLRDEAMRRGVPVHYGKRLADAKSTMDGVLVRFADGSEVSADLLVGADGLGSRTRKLIDPAAPPPRYTGLLNTGGYADGIDLPGAEGVAHMFFGRRCFYSYFKAPDGAVWWFANPASAAELGPAELAALSGESLRARLIELMAADNTPAARLVRASHTVLAPWNTYDLPTVPAWHGERTVLVGDAAHATSPTSGQGASLAIEDALVLAKCLRDLPEPAAAFLCYERLRRDRVERIVAEGKKQGDNKAASGLGRVVRDAVLPMVFRRMARRSGSDWVTGYTVDFDAPVRAS